MAEDRLAKAEINIEKLFGEVKILDLKSEHTQSSIQDIAATLNQLKDKEVEKAVERQKILNALTKLSDKQDEISKGQDKLGDTLAEHTKEEMVEQRKYKRWLIILSALVISIVIDSQSGTNIVGGIWKYIINHLELVI